VIARRKPGLEQQARLVGLGHDHAPDDDLDMPRAVEHVYPVVRVARMDEDLVIFLEPSVHLGPVERDVILEIVSLRLEVSPGGLLRDAIADLDGEEAGVPFSWM